MTKLGRYDIINEIGRGGFATVYKARDTQLNRLVALKVLHPGWNSDASFVRRFKQEAETVANFSHPNIVTIYDVGEIERQLFISMEFLPGEDLRRWLEQKNAPLIVSEALPILQPLADARVRGDFVDRISSSAKLPSSAKYPSAKDVLKQAV